MQKTLEKPSLHVATTTLVYSHSLGAASSSTASDHNVHPKRDVDPNRALSTTVTLTY